MRKKLIKKTIQMFFLIVLLPLITNGCVKQKDCDCSEVMTGTWQYLEEPVYECIRCNPANKTKIVAVFTEEGGGEMYFTAPVPSRYRSLTPVEVRLCAKNIEEGEYTTLEETPGCLSVVYKLICIEKED